MIQNLISKGKNAFSACYRRLVSLLRAWGDQIFPPLCAHCSQICKTKWFCPSCWALCSLPDPIEKCPHCFTDSDGLCAVCKKLPHLSFPRAFVFEKTDPVRLLMQEEEKTIAAFAIVQWGRLGWPIPDVILPMPGSKKWAYPFAEMLQRPMADILWVEEGRLLDEEAILEDQVLLVFDHGSGREKLQEVIRSLAGTFPKKGYVLSLY